MQACLYTFARPGEVRQIRWADLDLGAREWVYRVSKVAKDGHIVPLSDPMVDLIEGMRIRNGGREHVFAGPPGRVASDVLTGQLINRLGYKGRVLSRARCWWRRWATGRAWWRCSCPIRPGTCTVGPITA